MNEEQFSKLMQHSRLKMPFSDFEERTMARIQKETQAKVAYGRYRKLSWVFFVLGTVLGALATSLVSALPGLGTESLVLTCRLVYIVLLLAALNYLLRKAPAS